MSIQANYLFTASMDVDPEREHVFNEVYETEHVPLLLDVPGVLSIARFKAQQLTMLIGGQRQRIIVENQPAYSAIYELESPDVLVSQAWGEAVDQGRWRCEVRPYTKNRRHTLSALIRS